MPAFKKRTFYTKDNRLLEIPIKGEFHQGACRHIFEKGKFIKLDKFSRIETSRLPKDVTICIKCGKRK